MTETKDKAMQNGKRRRWPRVLLFVSLALNLLVFGIIAGALVLGPDRDRHESRGARDIVAPYTRALSDSDRRQIGKGLRDSLLSRNDERGLLAKDYRATLDILRSEPLDPVALDEVLSRQSERAHLRRQMGQLALAGRLIAMTPEERAAYADRLEAELDRLARGGNRSWRRHDH